MTPGFRNAPAPVWVVAVMTVATAAYQYPTYGLPGWALLPYVLGVGLLVFGTLSGARWAFVFTVATVWIFPLETLLGVKAPLHGTTLSLLHAAAVALLFSARGYFFSGARA